MHFRTRLYFSPFFITKIYLYREITRVISKYKFDGTVLDVGCGEMPYKELFNSTAKYLGIDYPSYSNNKEFIRHKPDYFFPKNYSDKYQLPFKSGRFNHVVAFQVLEHHPEPYILVDEVCRVVKKDGYVLFTVPFLGGIHEEPYDFQRYTEYGLRSLFVKNKCEIIKISRMGSIFSTISMLLDEYLCDYVNSSKITYVIGALLYLPFLLFQYLSMLLDIIFPSNKINIGYLILAKKT